MTKMDTEMHCFVTQNVQILCKYSHKAPIYGTVGLYILFSTYVSAVQVV